MRSPHRPRRIGCTRRNPLVRPRRGDVVAFLHAHPDDESIFTGGTLAHLAEGRAETVLITATLGELGRPNDPVVRARLGADAPIAPIRREELGGACRELGVTHQLFLGAEGRFGDSGYEARAPDCLARDEEAAAAELATLLRHVRPHVLVTFDRSGCTGHPDHLACHRIALRAAVHLREQDDCLRGVALIVDPLRRRRQCHRPLGARVAVDVGAVRKRKARAVSCHYSQVGDAVDDRTRLTRFDAGSAVARYVPQVLSDRPAARHEQYSWISAEELPARAAAGSPAMR